MNKIQWCIDQHRNTNHFYDKYLPYEFHLRMVAQAYEDFKHLLNYDKDYYTSETITDRVEQVSEGMACYLAIWGHDLIEDTRTSYNDVKNVLGQESADIIYAVTNLRGKTRSERAGDEYYKLIRETKGATFVKLCDRIANVQYSKMTKSRMFEMYKKENDHFMKQLGYSIKKDHELDEMFCYLLKLFTYD
jgi:(p)ppGpp synthase/HD superfamily hydrolase